MENERKSPRAVRVEIIVEASDPAGDDMIKAWLCAVGQALCDSGHSTLMRAEVLNGREEVKPARPADPNLN